MSGEMFTLQVPGIPTTGDTEKDRFTRLHNELMGYYAEMKRFNEMDGAEVFEKLSAWTARASEIRTSIVITDSRRSDGFRTKQLDPFISECDRQFRVHSRIQAIHEMDARLAGGRFT